MIDPFGRDWGYTLAMRGSGTSYATPRTSAVASILMSAHVNILPGMYGGFYASMSHCKNFLSAHAYGAQTYESAFLEANMCGAAIAASPTFVETLLPDPTGCALTVAGDGTPYYIEADCTLGYWHN